ncbi:hypothetical protein BD414DRAFT_533296 [Trametes punicea]|nr:hypothetical protein BD414DRAFT_533296 [Trametes punicea]
MPRKWTRLQQMLEVHGTQYDEGDLATEAGKTAPWLKLSSGFKAPNLQIASHPTKDHNTGLTLVFTRLALRANVYPLETTLSSGGISMHEGQPPTANGAKRASTQNRPLVDSSGRPEESAWHAHPPPKRGVTISRCVVSLPAAWRTPHAHTSRS